MIKKEFKIQKKDVDEFLFFSAYLLYLVITLLNTSFYAIYIGKYGKITMILCVLIIIYKEMLCNKLKIHEIVFLTICLILSSILFLHTNGFTMFPLFFILYGARKIKLEKIAKFTLLISSAIFIIVFISAKAGIILDYVSYSNNRIRHYLGFRYALYPSILLFNITSLAIYIDKKNKVIKYILLIGLNYILFKYTNSRLSFYLAFILIVCAYLIKKKPTILKNKRILEILMSMSFIICSLSSFLIIFTYDKSNKVINNLDIILEHRITLGNASLKEYPINLFGHDVEFTGAGLNVEGNRSTKKYNYVDCLYLNMLEKYGLIFSIVYILLMTYSLIKFKNEKKYILLLILTMIAIIGIIDDLCIYLYYNTFWFAIGESIIPKKFNK